MQSKHIKVSNEIGKEKVKTMPDIGQPAPDFTLPAQDMKNISLSDYRGEKAVVLSFHIFSFTGG